MGERIGIGGQGEREERKTLSLNFIYEILSSMKN